MENLKVYKVDGDIEEVEVEREEVFDTLKELVDGYVEIVTHTGTTYAVNEDGLSLGLLKNPHLPEFVGDVVEFDINLLDEEEE